MNREIFYIHIYQMANNYNVQNYFRKDLNEIANKDGLTPMALAALEGNNKVVFSVLNINFLDIILSK